MKLVITTERRTLTLGQYCVAWRTVKAAPAETEFKESLCGWWPESRETILGQFSYGVHDRINRHLPWFGKGRKWHDDWQRETLQAAQRINQPRLIIDWLPGWLKGQYAQRLRSAIETGCYMLTT